MKVKDLPYAIKKLAKKRRKQKPDDGCPYTGGFYWEDTKEGHSFWEEIDIGNYLTYFELYGLPEKWHIVVTKENIDMLREFIGVVVTEDSCVRSSPESKKSTEITTEVFKKFVLKQDKPSLYDIIDEAFRNAGFKMNSGTLGDGSATWVGIVQRTEDAEVTTNIGFSKDHNSIIELSVYSAPIKTIVDEDSAVKIV